LTFTRVATVFKADGAQVVLSAPGGGCAPNHRDENAEDVIPVVILNWNGEDDTIECLRSIRASIPAGFLPVLIDNGSKPENVARLKHECSQIFSGILFLRESEISVLGGAPRAEFLEQLGDHSMIFIENGENKGFAGGNNVGIKFAELIGAEWGMLLNNDTVVSPKAFVELRRFLRTYPSFTAVTAQIRHYKPNMRIQNCGGDLTYFGRQRYKFAGKDVSVVPDADYSVVTFVTGCALLFKFMVTGTLTEDFFFGEEDYEFSLRMSKLGLKMACVHGAVVYHKVGATIARSSRPLGGILVYYANRLTNTRNYYSKVRWQTTRLLAYLYLPVLFARKGIDVRSSLSAIKRVESHLKRHRNVARAEFQSLIMCGK
jgi:GT2 family glycosyltransferase